MSLQTRFMMVVIVLLIILVGSILLIIEQRERIAIFEEQKSKGLLIARYMAELNMQPLIFWDEEGIRANIEQQIDQNLLYIVFYDANGVPFTGSESIRENEEIYNVSRLQEVVSEDDYYFGRRRYEEGSGQTVSILEIEAPIFVEVEEDSYKKWGSIKIGTSLEEMHAENQSTRLMMALIGLGGLLIGIIMASLMARRITNPLKKLVDGTVKISEGDFTQKIDIESKDEIGDLARSFNHMSHQLLLTRSRMETANRKLIQAEKLASIGRLSASIAHEIRNPLTSVKLNIQKVLESERLDTPEIDHLSLSQEGISQIEIFIKELLNFARVSELNLDLFSMEQIIDSSLKMMADSFELKKIVLIKNFQEDLPQLEVDGDKLRQVFLNVLHNACEAVDVGGEVTISLSLHEKGQKKKMKIEVSDNGAGIPKKDLENIFEPFFTTKSSGIGLGLANARKIIERHKGVIKVKTAEGKGSTFEILLPYRGEK
jgi:signal transduction histidine kinase